MEEADGRCPRTDFAGRWSACCHAVRDSTIAYPHEYALIYGSPVPGSDAPRGDHLAGEPGRAGTRGHYSRGCGGRKPRHPFVANISPRLSKSAAAEAGRLQAIGFGEVPHDAVIRAVTAWTQLFGAVNFEVFGRLTDIVEDLSMPSSTNR